MSSLSALRDDVCQAWLISMLQRKLADVLWICNSNEKWPTSQVESTVKQNHIWFTGSAIIQAIIKVYISVQSLTWEDFTSNLILMRLTLVSTPNKIITILKHADRYHKLASIVAKETAILVSLTKCRPLWCHQMWRHLLSFRYCLTEIYPSHLQNCVPFYGKKASCLVARNPCSWDLNQLCNHKALVDSYSSVTCISSIDRKLGFANRNWS